MSGAQPSFTPASRALHWLMAVLILAMLFIGIGMVATVSARYQVLVAIHRPLGIAILLLAVIRIVNRLRHPPPPLPRDLPPVQMLAAKASHMLLYTLMLAQPLVGWAMVSAARQPIVMWRGVSLPPILPQSDALYATLRQAHSALAYLLFATFLLHLAAALFHALIRRDGVFASMAGAE